MHSEKEPVVEDQPGLYYVTVYLPLPDGTLEDNTNRVSVRARNSEIAKTRALQKHPGSAIVNVDFHIEDPVAMDDDFEATYTTHSDDDAL